MQFLDITGVVGYDKVEVDSGLNDGERNGVAGGVVDVGSSRTLGTYKVSGEGKEVLESERE